MYQVLYFESAPKMYSTYVMEVFALGKYFKWPYSLFHLTWKWRRDELPIIDSLCIILALLPSGFDQWEAAYQEIQLWEKREVRVLICLLLPCLAVVTKTYQATPIRELQTVQPLSRLDNTISFSRSFKFMSGNNFSLLEKPDRLTIPHILPMPTPL